MSLFDKQEEERRREAQPLAARMRPQTLEEFVGQEHFIGEGKIFRRMIKADRLGSVIFYGPPGTGKTTLARILARETKSVFQQISAVTSGVRELREIIDIAAKRLVTSGQKTVLFIDEIHRFNRAQQEVLLPHIEEGGLILVGATTENPFFSMTSALVSRSRVFEFLPLTKEHIKTIVLRALQDKERGLGQYQVMIENEALEFLAEASEGDARRALSALEVAVLSADTFPLTLTRQLIEDSLQKKAVIYDRQGDAHYDTISAFIKSIRGSDPDAAVYWLAKMLEAGEDVRFIARRLMILASEDIGNADPAALPLAVAAAQACEMIGLPECRLNLAQAAIYLACAPKSNAVITAIDGAMADIREGRVLPVPVHLRDANYPGAKRLGHGTGYIYSQDSPDAIAEQDYLGIEKTYYHPSDRGFEKELAARLEVIRERLRRSKKRESRPSTPLGPTPDERPPMAIPRKTRKGKDGES
ncbi:MAG: replication-associated recombination protein A [Thermogutta sp.]